MENFKAIGTPMSPSCKLEKDEEGKNVDLKYYRGMIGSLLYLTAVDLISYLVFVCVLDFNLILKNLT